MKYDDLEETSDSHGCPALADLRKYVSGQIDNASRSQMAKHFGWCGACQQSISDLLHSSAGTFKSLSTDRVDRRYDNEPGCKSLLASSMSLSPELSETKDRPNRPREIDKYTLLNELGKGGMGTVYEARHTRLNKRVAVKLMLLNDLSDASRRKRFENEMQALGKFEHPNLVRAYDAGTDHGVPYLVMELVDGVDLGKLAAAHGGFSPANVSAIGHQIAEGLQYAHARDVVHRDVKPANIMLTRTGVVKVMDLGLAKLEDPGMATQIAGQLGTPLFMAPEQGMPPYKVDFRADIYSLGATLYFLLCGKHMHEGCPRHALEYATANYDVPAVKEVNPDVPEPLSELVAAMTVRDPEQRISDWDVIIPRLHDQSKNADLINLANGVADTRPESDKDTLDFSRQSTRKEPAPAAPLTVTKQFTSEPIVTRSTKPRANAKYWIALVSALVVAVVALLPSSQESSKPLSSAAFVTSPEVIPGIDSWTVDTYRQRGPVNTIRFSPDGAQVVTSGDGNLRFWNGETGKLENCISAGTETWDLRYQPPRGDFAWLPDDSLFCRTNNGVLEFDSTGAQRGGYFDGSKTRALAVSPKKVMAAAIEIDSQLSLLLQTAGGQPREVGKYQLDKSLHLEWSPRTDVNEEVLAIATYEYLSFVVGAEPVLDVLNCSSDIRSMDWTADGSLLAVAAEREVKVFEVCVVDGLLTAEVHDSFKWHEENGIARYVRWVEDGKQVAVCNDSSVVSRFSVSTEEGDEDRIPLSEDNLSEIAGRIRCMEFNNSGDRIAVGGYNAEIAVCEWPLRNKPIWKLEGYGQEIGMTAWETDGESRLMVATQNGIIRFNEFGDGTLDQSTKGPIGALLPTTNGLILGVQKDNQRRLVFKTHNESTLLLGGNKKEADGYVSSIAMSGDGESLAARVAERVQIWDTTNFQHTSEIEVGKVNDDTHVTIAWLDSRHLVAIKDPKTLILCDVVSNEVLAEETLEIPDVEYSALATAGDNTFAVGMTDGSAKVYAFDAASIEPVNSGTISAHVGPNNPVRLLKTFADGSRIFYMNQSGDVGEWNAETSSFNHLFTGPTEGSFSGDGSRLATLSLPVHHAFDHERFRYYCEIWNMENGSQTGKLAVFPEEKYLAVGAHGHVNTSLKPEELIYIYSVGNKQMWLSADAFEEKFSWKNDKTKIDLF